MPMRGPNANVFASQWNIGFSVKSASAKMCEKVSLMLGLAVHLVVTIM